MKSYCTAIVQLSRLEVTHNQRVEYQRAKHVAIQRKGILERGEIGEVAESAETQRADRQEKKQEHHGFVNPV